MDQPNQWLPVIAAIGGAFVGAISTYFPAIFIEKAKQKTESKAIKSALIAEISVIMELIKTRRYPEEISNIIKKLEENSDSTASFHITVDDHYNRIYQSNVSKLGLLDKDIVVDIIRFYHLIDSAVIDVRPGSLIASNIGINEFKELLNIVEMALSAGERIIKTT